MPARDPVVHVPPGVVRPQLVLGLADDVGVILSSASLALRLAGNPHGIVAAYRREAGSEDRDHVLRVTRAFCETEVQ